LKLFQKCNLCGTNKTVRAYSDNRNVSLVKCIHCGFVYHDKNYEYTFPYNAGSDNLPPYHLRKAYSVELVAKSEMGRIEKHLSKARHETKLLEIGCGTGSFLKVLRELGYMTYGVDVNEASCAYAREQNQLDNIFEGSLETLNFGTSFFDIVILRHTFEHVTDPSGLLSVIRNVLVEDGIVAITVPNYEFITTKIGKCLSKKPFNKLANPICGRGHLYYYTPVTMGKFFDKFGFETLEMCYSYAWVPLIERTKYFNDAIRKVLVNFTYFANDVCEKLSLWRYFTAIGRKKRRIERN
jgi:2-polyprenyl-3-methyl-5-hydroxy-6-metoxy-1,4-benzoquinol methylase